MSKFLSVKKKSLNFGKEVLNSHGFVVLKSQQQVFWSKAFKVKKRGWVGIGNWRERTAPFTRRSMELGRGVTPAQRAVSLKQSPSHRIHGTDIFTYI